MQDTLEKSKDIISNTPNGAYSRFFRNQLPHFNKSGMIRDQGPGRGNVRIILLS